MFKRLIQLTLAVSAFATVASAQEGESTQIQNKNGVDVLPVQGEFAVGFNAVPVLSFLGNSLNGNTNNTYIGQNKFASAFGQNVIFGKYMLADNVALRGHLRIAFENDARYNYVTNDTQNSPDSLIKDKGVFRDHEINLGGGYEFRRGKGRIQGIYGGDAFVGFNGGSETYTYGNEFGMLNQAPTTSTSFPGGSSSQGTRLSSFKYGNSFSVGVRPFAGIEFFFAPKISLGAEFGWFIAYSMQGEGTWTEEYFDPNTDGGIVRENTIPVAGSNTLSIDTDNFNGYLYLMFYF